MLKLAILMSCIYVIVGCSSFGTAAKYYSDAPDAPKVCIRHIFSFSNSDKEFNDCYAKQQAAEAAYYEKYELPKIRAEQKKEAERELKIEQARVRASKAGATIKEYVAAFGEPSSKEVINGNDVYYYDDELQPMIVVFASGRLLSRIIDREELRQRELLKAQRENTNRVIEEQQRQENARQMGEVMGQVIIHAIAFVILTVLFLVGLSLWGGV